MRSFYRVILGQKHSFADHCFNKNVIAVGFLFEHNLKNDLYDDWRKFNRKFIPIWQKANPGRSKIAAGLSCGFLWTVSKGIKKGDIVLCPDGNNNYRIGEVTGEYQYLQEDELPHQRPVKWYDNVIEKQEMSQLLQNSVGSIGTVSEITKHSSEIEKLITGKASEVVIRTNDETIEDPSLFALEKHLEEFLITNWQHTELAKKYDIYEEGDLSGRQFQTDTGPIDILAISKDKKELVVIELKKGRASDTVVGQIQRYMGYVVEDLAEMDQTVKGIIIALEDDTKIKRALKVAQNIDFYRYQIDFKLKKIC